MSEAPLGPPATQIEPPHRSRLAQVAIAIFMGIPMTVALGIALVVYFAYEFVKFRIIGKPLTQPLYPLGERFKH